MDKSVDNNIEVNQMNPSSCGKDSCESTKRQLDRKSSKFMTTSGNNNNHRNRSCRSVHWGCVNVREHYVIASDPASNKFPITLDWGVACAYTKDISSSKERQRKSSYHLKRLSLGERIVRLGFDVAPGAGTTQKRSFHSPLHYPSENRFNNKRRRIDKEMPKDQLLKVPLDLSSFKTSLYRTWDCEKEKFYWNFTSAKTECLFNRAAKSPCRIWFKKNYRERCTKSIPDLYAYSHNQVDGKYTNHHHVVQQLPTNFPALLSS